MTLLASSSRQSPLPFTRILVTGADGFVGSHLIPALSTSLEESGAIMRAVKQSSGRSDEVVFDLGDPATIGEAVARARPELVIHLAAQASVAGSNADAAQTWEVNFAGTMALATTLAAEAPNATFVFASSAEVYGTTFNTEIATEHSALRPQSPYARSKAAAEAMLTDVLPPAMRLIVARLSNHSGAGQSPAFVIPAFARQIAMAERDAAAVVQVGSLDSRRDFMDVADAVQAYLVLLRRAADLPRRSVFNIASGRDVVVGDILRRMLAMAARPIEVSQDPARLRPAEVPVARIDCQALRALGWGPRIPLDDTLAAVLADQRRQIAAEAAPQ